MLINACVHTEAITDTPIYTSLLDFARTFVDITSERPIVCVMTPRCPLIAALMPIHAVSESEYARRIIELSRYSVIGYHGHFFHRSAPPTQYSEQKIRELGLSLNEALAAALKPINARDSNSSLLDRQFSAEVEWLTNMGLKPSYYTAGWWYLPAELPALLSTRGIRYDSSVKIFDPVDTFGAKQEGRDVLRKTPGGTPEEILSIVGLTAQPVSLCYRLASAQLRTGVRKGVLYFHDFDLPALYSRVINNVRILNRLPGVHWLTVQD